MIDGRVAAAANSLEVGCFCLEEMVWVVVRKIEPMDCIHVLAVLGTEAGSREAA